MQSNLHGTAVELTIDGTYRYNLANQNTQKHVQFLCVLNFQFIFVCLGMGVHILTQEKLYNSC